MKKLDCILIVDDDPVASFLHETLIRENIETECIDIVSDGGKALEYLTNHNAPSLILLDLWMPVIDGFEFLKAFKSLDIANKEKIKIVVLSSSIRKDDYNRAKELGALDYLTKPNNMQKMQDLLEKYF